MRVFLSIFCVFSILFTSGCSDQAAKSESLRNAEFGPHDGHLVELDHGGHWAELTFDTKSRVITTYLLSDDGTAAPMGSPTVLLRISGRKETQILQFSAEPLDGESTNNCSRFVARHSVPSGWKSVEDIRGGLAAFGMVNAKSQSLAGNVRHQHAAHAAHGDDAVRGISSKVWWLLIPYSVLIVFSSVFGGWLPSLIKLTHTRMQTLMSLVGGLMLGIGLFHLLPHGIHELGVNQLDRGIWWMVVGVISMFLLIRMFHFHSHDVDHDHDHDHDHGDCGHKAHKLSWMGVFFGLSLHTMIDGLALGASVQAEAAHASGLGLFGVGTFLAIALHKPLDAVSITTLMQAGGWKKRSQNLVNAAFAMMCPLGAILFVFGASSFGANQSLVLGCGLTFSAGVFLCISLGDLLPEMEFHGHNKIRLSALLLLGLALAYGIGFLEPAHAHSVDGGGAHNHSH